MADIATTSYAPTQDIPVSPTESELPQPQAPREGSAQSGSYGNEDVPSEGSAVVYIKVTPSLPKRCHQIGQVKGGIPEYQETEQT